MILRLLRALPVLILVPSMAATAAKAELRFCARTDVPLPVTRASSVVMADFYPGDGLDLAISFGASGRLSLWRNDGAGNFTETDVLLRPSDDTTPESLVSDPMALLARDFNGDGLIDLAGTNRTAGRYFAYLNPGVPGAWGLPAAPDARRGNGNAITTVDWNGDGALDLVFAQDSGAVSVAMGAMNAGSPTGSWGIVNRFTTTATVGVFTDVDVANFLDIAPESGTPDILATDHQYGQLVVWPGDPSRPGHVLTAAASLVLVPVTDASGTPLSPLQSIVGNWNGDSWPDVLVTTTQGVVLYFQGNGGPTVFDPPVRQDFVAGRGLGSRMPSDWTATIYEDVTGDGVRDLIVADAGEPSADRGSNWLTVLRGISDAPGPPAFDVAAQDHYAMGNMASLQPGSVAVGDVDGDGFRDIVVLHGDASGMTVLRNDGTGLFDAPFSFGVGGRLPRGLAAGHLDGDAFEDIVVAVSDPSVATVVVMRGLGGDVLGDPAALPAPASFNPVTLLVDQLNENQDSHPDVIVTNLGDQVRWLGAGDGTFGTPSALAAAGRIHVADFIGTPARDIAAVDRGASTLRLFEGDGLGGFTLRNSIGSIHGGRDVTTGSYFGGSRPDIVVAGSDAFGSTFGFYILRWNDALAAHDAPEWVTGADLGLPFHEFQFVETIDLDGSAPHEMLAFTPSGSALLFRVAGGNFVQDSVVGETSFGGQTRGYVVADLTGDGILDVAVADRSSVRIREGQPGGTFGPLLTLPSNIDNDALAAADLTGDGLPELIALSSRTADVTVFCNRSVGSLRLRVGRPFGADTLHWSDQGAAATFDVASGSLNDLWLARDFSGASCLVSSLAATSYVDVRPLPAPVPPTDRAAYYYLLKCSGADCTEPDFGTTSEGQPRFGPGSPGGDVPDPCP